MQVVKQYVRSSGEKLFSRRVAPANDVTRATTSTLFPNDGDKRAIDEAVRLIDYANGRSPLRVNY